ncbi:MAG: N-acylneuraminate-9-phosphate synthase [Dorea sp.]|nr:N-acylneuraminate-9-phosphate synthase [Dorea sp.]
MAKCIFRDGTVVSDYGRPYIVAEVNSSHRGDIEVAKQMVDVAADIGADCVKFQSWSAESLYSKTYYDANPISKKIVKKVSLEPEQLKSIAEYCVTRNVLYSSTPYSEKEVDFLINECNAPFVKIASMEINNLEFLRYIGKKEVPVVLSTGMSSMDEVERAVETLKQSGVTQMVVLHCVSIYPTVLTSVNLNNIIGLREKFPEYPIGFSDHTEGDAASVAAVALGAAFIEKHLTLDKSRVGMDNGMATEPEELKRLIDKCRNTQIAMGRKDRILLPEEIEQRKNMRRSIIAAVDIPKGKVIESSDLYAKRPGTGISPDKINDVVGKVSLKDIEKDCIISEEDIG